MDEQFNLLLCALRNACSLRIEVNQINLESSLIELNYIKLIESHLTTKEIEFESVREYLFWINKRIQSVNRKIKTDAETYNLGQSYLVLFVYLYNELEKIYFGNELSYKVAMDNIELMIKNLGEFEQ